MHFRPDRYSSPPIPAFQCFYPNRGISVSLIIFSLILRQSIPFFLVVRPVVRECLLTSCDLVVVSTPEADPYPVVDVERKQLHRTIAERH